MTKLVIDGGGVSDFFKSEAVASFLGREAARIAAQADAEVSAHVSGTTRNRHVMSVSKVLDHTAVAVVYTANTAANAVLAKHPEILSKHTSSR